MNPQCPHCRVFWKLLLNDAATDLAVRALVRKTLPEVDVDGDSHYAPGTEDLVLMLVDEIELLRETVEHATK